MFASVVCVRVFGGAGAALVPPSWCALPGCGSWCLPWCPFPPCLGPRSRPFLVLGWFPAPMCCRFRRPVPASACPHLGPFRALLPECSLVPLALPLPLSCPFLVWWWREGRDGEGAPAAQAWGWVAWSHWRRALGGVGGAEALDRNAEEGLPCRLRHDGLRGGLVGVCGGAGAHLLEGMHHVHPFVPSRSSGPLHPAAELLQSGGRPPGEVGGGPGGEGVRARGRGAAGGGRGPAVVAGVAVPGGAGAAAAGAGGGGRVQAEGGAGGGGGHGAAEARSVASGGAGVVVAGAWGGGWVRVAGGTGSPAGRVGGGGGGSGAAVACLAASGGAGVVVAGAGGGGLVWPVGGGGGGHGAAEALVVVPRGAGATGAGARGVVVPPGGAGAARVGG